MIVYIMFFIVIFGNIMMSLFIGVIINKMEDVAFELKDFKDAKKRKTKVVVVVEVWDDLVLILLKIGVE